MFVVCCGSGTDLWVKDPHCWPICQARPTETFCFLGLLWEQSRSVSLAPPGQQALTSGDPRPRQGKKKQQKNYLQLNELVVKLQYMRQTYLLFIIIFIHCSHVIVGDEFVGSHESSDKALLSACRLLAGNWRETWQKLGVCQDERVTVSSTCLNQKQKSPRTLRRISIVNDMTPSGLEMLRHHKRKNCELRCEVNSTPFLLNC